MNLIETDTLILGGGISGLMMGKLIGQHFKIVEALPRISFNIPVSYFLHNPIQWLSTPLEKVQVHTNCWNGENFYRQPTIGMMNAYSKKIAGQLVANSFKAFDNPAPHWYIPANGPAGQIIKDLFDEVGGSVICGAQVKSIDPVKKIVHTSNGLKISYQNLISTLHLPLLLGLLGVKFDADFSSRSIFSALYNIHDPVAHDVCQVVYITDSAIKPYRATLVGPSAILESMSEHNLTDGAKLIADIWGLKASPILQKKVMPGKFNPLPNAKRHALLGMLTSKYDIYCLGRFATWQHIVTDEVAKDAERILEIIKTKEAI